LRDAGIYVANSGRQIDAFLAISSDLDIAHDGELRADARHRKDEMPGDAQIRRYVIGTAPAKLHQPVSACGFLMSRGFHNRSPK
jgi:hypothetical protein